MTVLPQGFTALPFGRYRAFPSPRMQGAWHRRLAAAACAILCTAYSAASAAAPLSSAAHAAPSARIGSTTDGYAAFTDDASAQFNLPASWIRAVVGVESAGDAHAVSPKGAMGLMQLMPTTWAKLRDRYHLGANPFDPHDNIWAGAAYLRELLNRFGQAGFLAAYNAGPGRLQRHMLTAQPLPDETIRYLAALARLLPDLHFDGIPSATGPVSDWRTAGLFVSVPMAAGLTSSSPSQDIAGGATATSHFALAPHANGLFAATTPVDPR